MMTVEMRGWGRQDAGLGGARRSRSEGQRRRWQRTSFAAARCSKGNAAGQCWKLGLLVAALVVLRLLMLVSERRA